jgi:hypothetical protein
MKSSWIGSIAYCSQASSVVHVCRLPGKDYFISTTSASKVIPKAAEVVVPVTIDRSTVRAAYHIYMWSLSSSISTVFVWACQYTLLSLVQPCICFVAHLHRRASFAVYLYHASTSSMMCAAAYVHAVRVVCRSLAGSKHQELFTMPSYASCDWTSKRKSPAPWSQARWLNLRETCSFTEATAMHRSYLLLPVMTSWWHHAYVVIRTSPLTKYIISTSPPLLFGNVFIDHR